MLGMRQLHWLLVIIAGFSPLSSFADDLVQIYNQAVKSDPVFAQAKSTWESQKLQFPIAQSQYLPHLAVAANVDKSDTQYSPNVSTNVNSYVWQYGYSLTLTQPIFNYTAWMTIRGASASVKSATAAYIAAQQALIQRTATAYFSVMQAYDQLRYIIANKRAVWQQFVTAREQFKVGLIAITDEYDAHSRYDQVVAQQIAAQNNLNDQLETLRAITGRYYGSLKGMADALPLTTPRPNNIDQWVDVAVKQNYNLISQAYNVQAAMEAIKQQLGGGYPTLGFEGSLADARTQNRPPGSGYPLSSGTVQTMLGLQLSYQPIQGGLVSASIKQARYNYVTASGLMEQTHRQVVNNTRSNFLGVLSYISQVQADKQRIISAQNAVNATEAGLRVGTRTMADVLNDLTALYQAQQQYANDRYAYINSVISLKLAAGTLGIRDLEAINLWLKKDITFPSQLSVSRVPNEEMSEITTDGEGVKPVSLKKLHPEIAVLIQKSEVHPLAKTASPVKTIAKKQNAKKNIQKKTVATKVKSKSIPASTKSKIVFAKTKPVSKHELALPAPKVTVAITTNSLTPSAIFRH